MKLREAAFEHLVKRFYEAAAQPCLWPDVLHETALATGSAGVALIPFPSTDPVLPCSEGVAELSDVFVRGGWQTRNTRGERSAALAARNPLVMTALHTDNDLITPEEVKRDPYYQEFLAPRGFRWFLGGFLASAGGRHIFIDFERTSTSGPFSRDEIERMNALLGHFRTAGSLALRVGLSAEERTADIFDHLGCAAALLDAAGGITAR